MINILYVILDSYILALSLKYKPTYVSVYNVCAYVSIYTCIHVFKWSYLYVYELYDE